ncbi:hypothetical protein K2X05_05025 [bacterium]|nr:hypothetical protein [bacterium]
MENYKMTKIPSYVCFFEPIFVAIFISFTPELEYYFFPNNNKYTGPMLVVSIIIWTICLFVASLPLRELIKSKYNLQLAAQNYWIKSLKHRNSKIDVAELIANYKTPNLKQFLIPFLILMGGVIWLFYPILMMEGYFYPYAVLPILLSFKIATTIIKYNNIEPERKS